MSRQPEEEAVYYREIQKNAYLKRILPDGCNKLRPLATKKPPQRPLWTLFCVHNGRVPFLEQYPTADSPSVSSHTPSWRACLMTARHVTASVKRRSEEQHDFLIDTDEGPVRLMAPDWNSMQDWVSTLRSKLQELKIISKGENVYCMNAPVSRAGFRDPTSPLPPTPPVPPDRVPGIEINPTPTRQTSQEQDNQPSPTVEEQPTSNNQDQTTDQTTIEDSQEQIDISDWNSTLEHPKPSTSVFNQDQTVSTGHEPKVTKICGQSICLDDSILKRNLSESMASDEFFSELDLFKTVAIDSNSEFKQRVVVNSDSENTSSSQDNNIGSNSIKSTNITVIQVSNKDPPHTAIPVIGQEDVFSFEFKQNVTVNSNSEPEKFVNIVNTDSVAENNGYGTIFNGKDSDYDHLSAAVTSPVNLTLTGPNVTVTDVNKDGIYERLCMASTSATTSVENKKLSIEKKRKSSLPNLETNPNNNSTYEYLFPNSGNINQSTATQNNNNSKTINVTSNRKLTQVRLNVNDERPLVLVTENRQNINVASADNRSNVNVASTENRSNINATSTENRSNANVASAENLHENQNNTQNVTVNRQNLARNILNRSIERSHSQNVYDRRERQLRRENSSPKREGKTDRSDQGHQRPIWRRGLTELSLLTRLRGIGQIRRESPTREDIDRSLAPSTKVVHRSRTEARVDNTRRRSSSLNNGTCLLPLCVRAARTLRAELSRGAAIPVTVATRTPPLLVQYDQHVWVSWWNGCPGECRTGDRVSAIAGVVVRDLHTALRLFSAHHYHTIDMLYQKIPLAKVYVLTKERPDEALGVKLDSDCCISSVSVNSPAFRAGLSSMVGGFAITEVNNRPLNLLKNGDLEVKRLSACGKDVMVIVQPVALVKKIRQSLKQNKSMFKKGL